MNSCTAKLSVWLRRENVWLETHNSSDNGGSHEVHVLFIVQTASCTTAEDPEQNAPSREVQTSDRTCGHYVHVSTELSSKQLLLTYNFSVGFSRVVYWSCLNVSAYITDTSSGWMRQKGEVDRHTELAVGVRLGRVECSVIQRENSRKRVAVKNV